MNVFDINELNYQKAVSWSKHADTRASIVLAFNAALVALLVTDNPYTHGFVNTLHHQREEALTSVWGIGLFLCFLVFFVGSCVAAFAVLMFDACKTTCEHNHAFSFDNISDLSREQYRETLLKVNEQQALHALQDQTYIAAQLARKKTRYLRHAWMLLAGGIFTAVLFIIFTIFVVQSVTSGALH